MNNETCRVLGVDADKRRIDIDLQVNGFDYRIEHNHWGDFPDPGTTSINAVGHERHCEILSDEHWKYHFRGTFYIDGVNIQLHRTYADGCFVSVGGGPQLQTVATIDGQTWEEVDGEVKETTKRKRPTT